jgi:hypothetical protein
MQLTTEGAQHFPAAFAANQIAHLLSVLAGVDPGRPGTRLSSLNGRDDLIAPATDIARSVLGTAACPIRATLFDKSLDRNWSLGWHQDRTIAVRERMDVPGFTHWTLKSGIHHVMPPIELLERMLTLRIHLDPVGPDNAPLLIAPGSDRLGRIAEPDIPAAIDRYGTHACLAGSGDVWLYATLILHASAPARTPGGRRVLQLLYSADELPSGLEWLGV